MSSTNFPNDNRRKNLLTLQTLSESKFLFLLEYPQGFPGAQTVKNLPTMQETWVRPLGWEDPLEEKMAIHSNILAWRIPWAEEPGGSWGRIELNTTERLTSSFSSVSRSCLTLCNPMDCSTQQIWPTLQWSTCHEWEIQWLPSGF